MRRMKFLFLAFLLCMFWLSGVSGIVSAQTRDDAQARAAFLEAFKVFSHARCVNCHPAGDAPLQGEDSRPHLSLRLRRGVDGVRSRNQEQRVTVRGRPHYRLGGNIAAGTAAALDDE